MRDNDLYNDPPHPMPPKDARDAAQKIVDQLHEIRQEIRDTNRYLLMALGIMVMVLVFLNSI